MANRSGAMAVFQGCAFDYCRQWFVGSGLNQFFGCWFEKHRPAAEQDIPFDLVAGNLLLQGGGIQISGIDFAQGNRNRFMFMARDRLARIVLRDCFAWNWRTASGVLAGGEPYSGILSKSPATTRCSFSGWSLSRMTLFA